MWTASFAEAELATATGYIVVFTIDTVIMPSLSKRLASSSLLRGVTLPIGAPPCGNKVKHVARTQALHAHVDATGYANFDHEHPVHNMLRMKKVSLETMF